jgi:hypothetical protein
MSKKPCGTWIVTDIPEDRVGNVMAAYRSQDLLGLEKAKQADGRWKVTAVFPDCPAGQANLRERSHSGG